MNTVDLIAKKRDGKQLSSAELNYLVEGYVSGSIPDYQMSAFCMAVYFQGMSPVEIGEFTMAIAQSGDMLNLNEISGLKIDKHSTGGVGDTTTLILAPLVASCGVPVAKMSGRGLGHTGGTIDKLESIPGFNTELSTQEFINQVNKIGVSVVGQTAKLAPADKLLYALRDVTATVESIPLLASSIMSKKLAAGADGYVLDVKMGRGAFLQARDDAFELARTMVAISKQAGKKSVALITDMNQPLGRCIGNSLEVREAILTLSGEGPANLTYLCQELASEMLVTAGLTSSQAEARAIIAEKLKSKAALNKFRELIDAQGGNSDVVSNLKLLPQASFVAEVSAPENGYIQEIDPRKISFAASELGAGRITKDTIIDLAVGIELKYQVGDYVHKGDPIAFIHANNNNLIPRTSEAVEEAIVIMDNKAQAPQLVYGRITTDDV